MATVPPPHAQPTPSCFGIYINISDINISVGCCCGGGGGGGGGGGNDLPPQPTSRPNCQPPPPGDPPSRHRQPTGPMGQGSLSYAGGRQGRPKFRKMRKSWRFLVDKLACCICSAKRSSGNKEDGPSVTIACQAPGAVRQGGRTATEMPREFTNSTLAGVNETHTVSHSRRRIASAA